MDSNAFLLARNGFGWTFVNASMETGNDVAQTMIDAAYGYRNFDRFKRRFLLMRWNRGDRKMGAPPNAPPFGNHLGFTVFGGCFFPITFNHHRSYRAQIIRFPEISPRAFLRWRGGG